MKSIRLKLSFLPAAASRCWHRSLALLGLGALSLSTLPTASAAPLLTSAYEAQLETWLGLGDLTFSSIFEKVQGDGKTAADFHAAADYKGPTITLLSIYGYAVPAGTFLTIGGYNPQSWNNWQNDYAVTENDADRTAFIFNLSSGELQNQRLGVNEGKLQTYNGALNGPGFGGGDIVVSGSQVFPSGAVNLEFGSSYSWSYGTGTNDITLGGNTSNSFHIAALEVYTFAPAPTGNPGGPTSSVPDAASTGLLAAITFAGLIGFRQSKGGRRLLQR